MGVFSRFRRNPKAAAEASTEEAASSTLTAEPPAESGSTSEASHDAAAEVTEVSEADEPAVTEGVEIPKQQSAEEAADNEAGEGARK